MNDATIKKFLTIVVVVALATEEITQKILINATVLLILEWI